MKDYYKILGVERDASQAEIKKAFRDKALKAHTDKGGDKADMQLLNEAKDMLSDPAAREQFDQDWEAHGTVGEDEQVDSAGLISSSSEPFSTDYRRRHAAYYHEFKAAPLREVDVRSLFESVDAETLRAKDNTSVRREMVEPEKIRAMLGVPMRPKLAVELFLFSLEGLMPESMVEEVENYFRRAVETLKDSSPEKLLYESIAEMIAILEGRAKVSVVKALNQLTDYVKKRSEAAMSDFVILFQNRYFRNFVKEQLMTYWLQHDDVSKRDSFSGFDGREATKEIIINLRELLARYADRSVGSPENIRKHLRSNLKLMGLLYRFEVDLQKEADGISAEALREKAFHTLDWFPAFLGMVPQSLMINLLLQAGVYFQRSAFIESDPALRMTDERLALSMYMNAMFVAQKATPNIELYARVHGLKLMASFSFEHEGFALIIKSFQERSFVLANIFPFYEGLDSNVNLFSGQTESLMMMRHLLHALIDLIEKEVKKEAIPFRLDHRYADVFYEAYAAALRSWYEEHYSSKTEESLRVRLMEILLFEKGWSFDHVNENLDSEGVNIFRDRDGWLIPEPKLPIAVNPIFRQLQALAGLDFNYATGEINFVFHAAESSMPSQGLLTSLDLAEMVKKNLEGGFFSLDGVDPDMQFHPFNLMRFGPSSLYRTQLMHSMLFTDYLLKFFTVGREVRGKPPYDRRTLDELLKKLPSRLKQIIMDFHESQKEGSAHRFWIETGEVALTQELNSDTDHHRFAIGQVKMVVKKHQLRLDERGNLIDDEEQDEGWNLYVMDLSAVNRVTSARSTVKQPAMIFSESDGRVIAVNFYENDRLDSVPTTELEGLDARIERLLRLKRADDGLIVREESPWLNYEVTREIAKQARKLHHFSPEYCFAQEFSAYYNDFAQYFPEFARLRELSRASVVIRILNQIRESNHEAIKKLTDLLSGDHFPKKYAEADKIIRDADRDYDWIYAEVSTTSLSPAKSLSDLPGKIIMMLKSLSSNIGVITVGPHSAEVNEAINTLFEENKQNIIRNHGYGSWYQNQGLIRSKLEDRRAEYAEEFTKQKFRSVYGQLREMFNDDLSDVDEERVDVVREFIFGETKPLGLHVIRARVRGSVRDERNKIEAHLLGRVELDQNFKEMGLPEEVPVVDLTDQCVWVPANVAHHPSEGRSSLVYGGVLVQPKIRMVPDGSGMHRALLRDTFASSRQVILNQDYIRDRHSDTVRVRESSVRLAQQRAADSAAATARANAAMEAQRRATEAATAAARAAASRLREAISRQTTRVGMATSVEIPSAAAARVAAAGGRGGNGGGGFRGGPPVAPPPPPPPPPGGSSGGRGGGSVGGQRPPDPPSGSEGASASSGANARPANSGAGDPPPGRSTSPTSFYDASRARSGSTDHVAHNAAHAVRMATELAFRAAGIMDERGKLTQAAIDDSRLATNENAVLSNPSVVRELTKDGSAIEGWKKKKTPSIRLPSGQRVQIHFYHNVVTGKVNYTHHDYKVKGGVDPLGQRAAPER